MKKIVVLIFISIVVVSFAQETEKKDSIEVIYQKRDFSKPFSGSLNKDVDFGDQCNRVKAFMLAESLVTNKYKIQDFKYYDLQMNQYSDGVRFEYRNIRLSEPYCILIHISKIDCSVVDDTMFTREVWEYYQNNPKQIIVD